MAESDTLMCRICLDDIKDDAEFYSLANEDDLMLHSKLLDVFPQLDLNITQNPIACSQCTITIDDMHQFKELCMETENILKNRRRQQLLPHHTQTPIEEIGAEIVKEEYADEALKTETIEESTVTNTVYYCSQCVYSTDDKIRLTDHIFSHRFRCNKCAYTTASNSAMVCHEEVCAPNVLDTSTHENEIVFDMQNVFNNNNNNTSNEIVFDTPSLLAICEGQHELCAENENDSVIDSPISCVRNVFDPASRHEFVLISDDEMCVSPNSSLIIRQEKRRQENEFFYIECSGDSLLRNDEEFYERIENRLSIEQIGIERVKEEFAPKTEVVNDVVDLCSKESTLVNIDCDNSTDDKTNPNDDSSSLITHEVTHNVVKLQGLVGMENVKEEFGKGGDMVVGIEDSTVYYCAHCTYVSVNKLELRDHVRTHRLKCNQCSYTTPDEFSLKTHREIHLNIGPLQCDVCDFSCIVTSTLDEHMNTHDCMKLYTYEMKQYDLSEIYEGVFECYDCGYQTNCKFTLEFHVMTHKKVESVLCKICNFNAHSEKGLKSHMLKHKNFRTYKCAQCNFSSMIRNRLMIHSKVHEAVSANKIKKFKCETCGFSTSTKVYLKEHVLRIHKRHKLKYKCKLCKFASQRRNALMVHTREHTGERPYRCEFCEYRSKTFGNLRIHRYKHTGDWPFKCDRCDYKTHCKITLVQHRRSHTGEKPFKCNLCDYRSSQSSSLKSHMYKHSGDWPYSCENCTYKTHSKADMTRHSKRHGVEKPFQCKQCCYRFSSKHYLQGHENRHSCCDK